MSLDPSAAIDTGEHSWKAFPNELQCKVFDVHPVLIILETLGTMVSGRFNENKVADVFANLGELQAQCGSTIILSHHLRKSRQRHDPISSIRGSKRASRSC